MNLAKNIWFSHLSLLVGPAQPGIYPQQRLHAQRCEGGEPALSRRQSEEPLLGGLWPGCQVHEGDWFSESRHLDFFDVFILQGRRKCAQGRETGSAEGSRRHYRVFEQVDCCDLSQNYKTIFRDAHLGCTARRSDLENLALNLVHWSLGTLPWLSLVSKTMKPADLVKVQAAKIEFFDNLPSTGKGLPKQVVSPQYMVMGFNLFIVYYLLLYQQKN